MVQKQPETETETLPRYKETEIIEEEISEDKILEDIDILKDISKNIELFDRHSKLSEKKVEMLNTALDNYLREFPDFEDDLPIIKKFREVINAYEHLFLDMHQKVEFYSEMINKQNRIIFHYRKDTPLNKKRKFKFS